MTLDGDVSRWFEALAGRSEWLVDVAEVGAFVLHPWVFRLLVILACVVVWRAGRRRAAVVVGLTMVLGSLLGAGLKLLVRRPRPAWGDPVAEEIGFSMPSGHALGAALGVGLLLVLAWPWLVARRWTLPAVVAGVVVVVLTALDRLVLGVHYLTDVVAGVLLGAALALLACRVAAPPRGSRLNRR